MNSDSGLKIKSLMIKIAVWIPVLAMCFLIFGFSGQNGESSSGLSDKIADSILNLSDNLGIVQYKNAEESVRADMREGISAPIRKTAHMTEYAILSALVLLALLVDKVKLRLALILSWFITTAFATSDEIHQLFVDGRSGQFTDVCIDSAGALICLTLIFFLISFFTEKRKLNT